MNSLAYAPAGGRIVSAYDTEGNIGLFPQMHHRLIVGARTLELEPGATSTVTYVMITGKNQSGDVAIRSTPGAQLPDAGRILVRGAPDFQYAISFGWIGSLTSKTRNCAF